MKKSIFALAVLAIAVPGLALAGEPVPMNDNDLDAVTAGASINNALQLNAAIRAHKAEFQSLAAKNSGLFFKNEALVRKLIDNDLEYLLPKAD